jgi:hypothetical protein
MVTFFCFVHPSCTPITYIYTCPRTGQAHGRARVGDCPGPCNGSCKSSSLLRGVVSFASTDLHRYSCCGVAVWCRDCEVLLFLPPRCPTAPPATSRRPGHAAGLHHCAAFVFKCNPVLFAVSLRRTTYHLTPLHAFITLFLAVASSCNNLEGSRRKRKPP